MYIDDLIKIANNFFTVFLLHSFYVKIQVNYLIYILHFFIKVYMYLEILRLRLNVF